MEYIDGYILDPNNNKIVDFKLNNLHIWGYSEPINKTIDLDELQNHLYSIEDYPDVIPYVTSYYKKKWGFCISTIKNAMKGKYQVVIKSCLSEGS